MNDSPDADAGLTGPGPAADGGSAGTAPTEGQLLRTVPGADGDLPGSAPAGAELPGSAPAGGELPGTGAVGAELPRTGPPGGELPGTAPVGAELPGTVPAGGNLPGTALADGQLAGTEQGPDAEAASTARARVMAARLAAGWPLRRTFAVGVVISVLFAVLAIVIGGTSLANLSSSRDRVVNKIDPAAFQTSQLGIAFLNQETGVRGYEISARPSFLAPYFQGLTQQSQNVRRLRGLLAGMPAAQADLTRVTARADAWRASYAVPTIKVVRASGKPFTGVLADQGKADFDRLRVALGALQGDLTGERSQAVSALNQSASLLDYVCIGIGVALLAILIVFAFILDRSVIRPLSRLAGDARQVADGDFAHHVDPGGPQEVRTVGTDVNRMRERILAELSAVRATHASLEAAHASLQTRTEDLQRSNAELEQFAYVASHDLQEPLRKVASFCQLLQRRYAGRLDEKADQYIEHAVDGAKRMQALINDLLAFSRVGRTAQQREPVSCAVLLAQAWANLGPMVRQAHAKIEVGDLPVVLGEGSLLTAVFQNLLSNALKFSGDQPPRVAVSARRDGQNWLFSFTDNGIGIPAEYAERIFVIFQRLHDRATYPGTGIGLAMCRKIIEYHGGRIWLDTTVTPGTRFCFTLPVLPEDADGDD